MHVDMDAFFAAVEQRDRPALRGRPVIVGARPGQRGVVATCSYEARGFGVRSAMPIAEAYRRCPQAVYLSPDMDRYRLESRRVMRVLHSLSPTVEPVSVDEAFLDISGLEKLYGPPQAVARLARERIFRTVGLTASVGIGPNRLVAKLASEACKPDGAKVVPEDRVLEFLAAMPLSRLRGIGDSSLRRIQSLGVRTVGELREVPLQTLQARLGPRAAAQLLDQAFGRAADVVAAAGERKSISKETTFQRDVVDPSVLRGVLLGLAAEVGCTARRAGLRARVLTLKLRFSDFTTRTRRRSLDRPTNSDRVIFHQARALCGSAAFQGRPVRLIGIGLSHWEETPGCQLQLFAGGENEGSEQRLYAAIDAVRERFGRGKLQLGLSRKPRPETS